MVSLLQKIDQQPVRDILISIRNTMDRLGFDFFLIGGIARDIMITGMGDMPLSTRTKDVDIAVLISNEDDFHNLKKEFMEKENFRSTKENSFALFTTDGTVVDISPFGELTDSNYKIQVAGTGMTSIQVDGFSEVYVSAVINIEIDAKLKLKVCSIPGLVILKLIALDDRPEMRTKDAEDIARIINIYFDLYEDEIYAKHYDLFDDDLDDLKLLSSRVLGRHLGAIIEKNKVINDRILKILDSNYGSSTLKNRMALDMGITLEKVNCHLVEISKGIKEDFIN